MEVLLETYYILLPIVATGLIGWVGILLKDQKKQAKIREAGIRRQEEENKKRQTAQSEALMLILRYMLQRYHGEYMLQGKITYSQLRNWRDIYSAYAILGGNSIAEEWNEEVEELDKYESSSEMSLYESIIRKKHTIE